MPTRVWLSEWEWACCGTPFEVGAGEPSPYSIEGESVSGTARLVAIDRVPRPSASPSAEEEARFAAARQGEGPAEWTSRNLAGYLVEVERDAAD